MFLDAEAHIAYEFGNARIRDFPFPHFYLENVFPEDFYEKIQFNLPSYEELSPIAQKRPVTGYKERFVCCFDDDSLKSLTPDKGFFWTEFRNTFLKGDFGNLLLSKFQTLISTKFKGEEVEFYDELLLVHDIKNYKLGPHTDAVKKVITILFYLPSNKNYPDIGTSIYVPTDPNFLCEGGPHHKHENFIRVKTMPFLPNSAFCFFKTNNSFHGVERLNEDGNGRWLLLYDIYAKVRVNKDEPQVSDIKFSF